jgi:hypothetical protein
LGFSKFAHSRLKGTSLITINSVPDKVFIKGLWQDGCWWLRPVILVAWKAEIGRIEVQSQPRQIVHKNRADGVAQGEGSEFKPQYCKKKKKKEISNTKILNSHACMPQLRRGEALSWARVVISWVEIVVWPAESLPAFDFMKICLSKSQRCPKDKAGVNVLSWSDKVRILDLWKGDVACL